jgi:hypothetical protein
MRDLLASAAAAQRREDGQLVTIVKGMRVLYLVAVHDAEKGDALGDAKSGQDVGDPRAIGKLEGDTVAIGVAGQVVGEGGKEPEPDLQR